MQWWTFGDDTGIGYYRDNLPLCNLVTNNYCSKMVILFNFLFLKMESIVTLKILGEITHVRVCMCVHVYVHVHVCMLA